jgi:hypothetical protein
MMESVAVGMPKRRLVRESIRVETKLGLLKKEIPIAS